jgi:hypothetical protein
MYSLDPYRMHKEVQEIRKSVNDVFDSSLEKFTIKNEKIYFDYCHISPIKMHFSFSLADANSKDPTVIGQLLLEQIGTVPSDVQDVVFK